MSVQLRPVTSRRGVVRPSTFPPAPFVQWQGHLVVCEETTVRLPSRGARYHGFRPSRLHRLTAGRQALNLETGVRLSVELSLHPHPERRRYERVPRRRDDGARERALPRVRRRPDPRVRIQLRRHGRLPDQDRGGPWLGQRRGADGRQPRRVLDADRRSRRLPRHGLAERRRLRHRLRGDGGAHPALAGRHPPRPGPAGGRDRHPHQLRPRPQERDAGRPRAVRFADLGRDPRADRDGRGPQAQLVTARPRGGAAGHGRQRQPLRRPAGRARRRLRLGGLPLRQPRLRPRDRDRVPEPGGAPGLLLADARRRVDARRPVAAAAHGGCREGAGRPAAGRRGSRRDRPPLRAGDGARR